MNFDWTSKEPSRPPEDAFSDEIDHWAAEELDACLDAGSEAEPEADTVMPTAEEVESMMAKLIAMPQSTYPGAPEYAVHQGVPPASTPAASTMQLAGEDAPKVSIHTLDPELRDAFLDDARGCVHSMEAALLRLESEPMHSDSLIQIGRELHTLKGASASVGLIELADQLHRLEDALHDDQVASRKPCFDSLLKSVDSIRLQIADGTSQPSGRCTTAAGVSLMAPAEAAYSEDATDDESVRVKSSQLNRLMDMLAELVMLRNRRETELVELQEIYHELIGSVTKMRLLCHEGHQPASACSSLQLSEIANDVLEVAQNVRDCARPVAEGNTAVSQFIRQFRQELVELRRTPVSGLFHRLQRVVRDVAQSESKDVQLKLVGEDAGIERSLQQRLYEPLLHIVRNSVCHGIETAEVRKRHGKHPVGTITVEAKSGPDLFVIEIRDDGNGLDYDAIRRRGIESGLIVAGQATSRQELSQLIFHPGFSTRHTANQSAGRGVGMDVVASTLQRMRGWLDIDSEPQQGTRIRLSFPLPSVIQHAMVFRSAEQLFALPMQSVQSIGDAAKIEHYLDFSAIVSGQKRPATAACQHIVLSCETSISPASESGVRRVTLLVDEIVGPEEVVVRPLPTLLKPHPFCSGATLSGMGKTVILLDARRMVEARLDLIQSRGRATDAGPTPATEHDLIPSVPPRPCVLVVDDSLSARKRVVRSLKRYPFEVIEACDGKEAMELLKTQRFVAVFSDLEMPHVTGMELLAETQSLLSADAPAVVIISSRSDREFTDRARELGVSSYLTKPLTDESLDRALAGIPLLAVPHV